MYHKPPQRLSVQQILEALSDDNRFYTSRALGKRWDDVTARELIEHYARNSPPGMTIVGYDVAPATDEHMFV